MKRKWLTFVETDAFTSRVARLGLESALHALQVELVEDPERGHLDAGTGGLRKVRMSNPTKSKGKRGGARVHYLWLPHLSRVYLVFVYAKGEQDSLSKEQKAALREVVWRIGREA